MRNLREVKLDPVKQEYPGLSLAFLEQFTLPAKKAHAKLLSNDNRPETNRQFKTGFVIGRFQPLHFGHVYLLQQALTIADTITIAVGSANVRNEDNPFSAEVREKMVRSVLQRRHLSDRVLKIVHNNDYIGYDDLWLEETLGQIGQVDVVIGNNDWVNGIFRNKGIQYRTVPELARTTYQGTVIRAQLRDLGLLPHN